LKVSCRGDYIKERKNKYPPIEEYIDAQIKINSRDLFMQKEGQKQFQKYIKVCLQVKEDYPKVERE